MLNPKYYNADGSIKQITEPGIYFDMPIEVYHAQRAVSCSGLKQLLRSPWHYWAGSPLNPNREPFKKTPSLIKGQKFHKWLLERDTFFEDYTEKKGVNASTVEGMVGEGELNDLKQAVTVLQTQMPKVVSICLDKALREVSMFWLDAETGILCRCRHDIFKPHVSTDYKTAADVSPRDCIGSVVNYDYAMQASYYLSGNKAVFKNHVTEEMKARLNLTPEVLAYIDKHSNFVFLFQEPTFPFTPYAVTIEDELLQKGYNLWRYALTVYKDCLDRYGHDKPWPAFGDEVKPLGKNELEFYGKGWYLQKETPVASIYE